MFITTSDGISKMKNDLNSFLVINRVINARIVHINIAISAMLM